MTEFERGIFAAGLCYAQEGIGMLQWMITDIEPKDEYDRGFRHAAISFVAEFADAKVMP